MDEHIARWYVAVLVVRARVGDGRQDEPWTDHQIRLIRAVGAEAAYTRALALGAEAEHSYANGAGATVRWEFRGLADLDEIDAATLTDGLEIYSWRQRGEADELIPPKEKLAVFWSAANAHRTADDLLE